MRTKVETLYLIDDASDESFMARMYFKRQKIALEISYHARFEDFLIFVSSENGFDSKSSIVVIDLNLTLSKGTDDVERLRCAEGGGDIIAGICTGSEDPADRKSAEEVGADFFVPKPLDRTAVEAIVQKVPDISSEIGEDDRLTLYRD